jgi:adenylosuccinate synthase
MAFDSIRESKLKQKIGTTKKGIGPAYTDKAERSGIRMGEFVDLDVFKNKLQEVLEYKNQLADMYGVERFDFESMYEEYSGYAKALKPFVENTSKYVNEAISKGSKVLFEGAQGTLLCLDHGTYPFVTSSSPTAASVPINVGIAPWLIQGAVGVTKAYTTRVGEGPLPTELFNQIGSDIREKGHEYGTTTGRPRRVGWLDLVLIKHAKLSGGLSGLAVTLLDVLSGQPEIMVCTAYELDGKIIDEVPSLISDFERVKPIYTTLKGWSEDITDVKSYNDLPINTKNYLRFIEEETGIPVVIFSVGPDRNQTIEVKNIF